MATPGQITLNNVVAGVTSVTASYTQTAPFNAVKIYFQWKLSNVDAWSTFEILEPAAFTIFGLTGGAPYDFRLRGVSATEELGPWSGVLTTTPIISNFNNELVAWDERGVRAGPFVDNVGAEGGSYNLDDDIIFGGGSNSNVTRNGKPAWQANGASGLRTSPSPPPDIAQPVTVYIAFVSFFFDGNLRFMVRGGFNDFELRLRNNGFAATKDFFGIYNVGAPSAVADGRLVVLEYVVNNSGSSLRVRDDVGNDSGIVGGDIQSASGISPESLSWDFAQSANKDAPGLWCAMLVMDGIGTTAEREAIQGYLFQQWAGDAPTLIGLVSGGAGIALDDSDTTTSGTIQFAGSGNMGTEDCLTNITGTVDTPPPPAIVPPESPSVVRVWSHLLPQSRAFKQ